MLIYDHNFWFNVINFVVGFSRSVPACDFDCGGPRAEFSGFHFTLRSTNPIKIMKWYQGTVFLFSGIWKWSESTRFLLALRYSIIWSWMHSPKFKKYSEMHFNNYFATFQLDFDSAQMGFYRSLLIDSKFALFVVPHENVRKSSRFVSIHYRHATVIIIIYSIWTDFEIAGVACMPNSPMTAS